MNDCSLRTLETALPSVLLIAYFLFDILRTLRLAGRTDVGRDKMGCLLVSLVGSFVAAAAMFAVATLSHMRNAIDDLTYYVVIAGSVPLMKCHTESISALVGSDRVRMRS